jgi:hypothetical protein
MWNKCISFTGHFDGHADAWVQGCLYFLMRHVHGYTKSLWTPPSGNYSLHLAPEATLATANKTTCKNTPTVVAILMATVMCR